MSIALRMRAVKAYGDLLRAQRNLFGEDTASRLKALAHTRLQFRQNQNVTDANKIEELVSQAELAVQYIETCIIQGVKNEKGNFSMSATTWKGPFT